MALASIFSLDGCSLINRQTADETCKALKEKYGIEFVADRIGDRIMNDSARLYVHAVGEEDIVFEAQKFRDSDEVFDEYIEKKVAVKLQKEIASELKLPNAEEKIFVEFYNCFSDSETDTGISCKDFLAKYPADAVNVYITINSESACEEIILDILNVLSEKNKTIDVDFSVFLFVIPDEKISECSEIMRYSASVNVSTFKRCGSTHSSFLGISKAELSCSSTEVLESLLGD